MSHVTRLICIAMAALMACVTQAARADDANTQSCTATGAELAPLMEKTQVGAVMNYEGLPAEYKSDGNPDTLELVFMKKAKGLVSSVSEDGEVIFLVGKVKDAEQSKLIELAFCRRAVIRRG